jgi:hypothetical protein
MKAIFGLAAAGLVAATVGASASPIAYTIDPGSGGVLNGNTVTVTGSFTYDQATFTESAVSIILSGFPGRDGTYVDTPSDISELLVDNPNLAAGVHHYQDICGTGVGHSICVGFDYPLGNSTLNLIFLGAGDTGPDGPATGGITFAATGSASPTAVAAVPEPITLSLFGAGVVGAFGMRRRKKAAK